MSLSYLMPHDQLSFEELLTTVEGQTLADAQNFEALFGNVLNSQVLHQQLAVAAAAQHDLFTALGHNNHGPGSQEVLDFSNFVSPSAFSQDGVCDATMYGSGSESPDGSDASSLEQLSHQSNPFAALVIPSDKAAAATNQTSPLAQPFQLFPSVTNKPPTPTAFRTPQTPGASPELQPAGQPIKRQHRAPTVTWQPAPGRAPTSVAVTAFSPASMSMPSPPLSPTASVKDEAVACAPSPMHMGSERTACLAADRTMAGGIRTPFDDMADEDLDDLDEDEIMGMMGKVQHSKSGNVGANGQVKEKKKRKRRTTAELAPLELEVRRIKNSEAARRCRLRKTLKLRWLEARCTELEETNVKLLSRLSDLEARLPKP